MHIEDAESILIRVNRERPTSEYSNYGYDVYIPNVIRWHLQQAGIRDRGEIERQARSLSPGKRKGVRNLFFTDAALAERAKWSILRLFSA